MFSNKFLIFTTCHKAPFLRVYTQVYFEATSKQICDTSICIHAIIACFQMKNGKTVPNCFHKHVVFENDSKNPIWADL